MKNEQKRCKTEWNFSSHDMMRSIAVKYSDELRKIYETIVLRSINSFIPKK